LHFFLVSSHNKITEGPPTEKLNLLPPHFCSENHCSGALPFAPQEIQKTWPSLQAAAARCRANCERLRVSASALRSIVAVGGGGGGNWLVSEAVVADSRPEKGAIFRRLALTAA
jgi:hypothetical protein